MARPGHNESGGVRRHRGFLPLSAVAAVVIVLLLAVQLAVIGLLSAGGAYVHAEGRWSKAQQEAVFRLDRYAETGAAADLAAARQALEVPLGDRRARRALQGNAYDYGAARDGFLQGGNHPADVPYLIWSFEYFEVAPYVDRAIAIWALGDQHIARLRSVADALEAAWSDPEPDIERIASLRDRLRAIDAVLRPLEHRFSEVLGAGMRALRGVLAGLSAGITVALVGLIGFTFAAANRRLAESERRFAASFEHAPLGVALVASDGCLIEVNRSFCKLLACERSELIGSPFEGRVHPEDRDDALLGRASRAPYSSLTVERRYLDGSGNTIWGRLTVTAYPAGLGGEGRFIAVLEDVSEIHRQSEELAYQASHDALTGLPNRRWLEAELDRLVRASGSAAERHVVAYVDLDGFKAVNDTCGHAAGDDMLKAASECMLGALRGSDVLARVGGDEFAVVLRHCDRDAARIAGRKLCDAVRAFRFEVGGRSFPLTASVGLEEIRPGSVDSDTLLARADSACYAAKQAGGDCVLPAARSAAE